MELLQLWLVRSETISNLVRVQFKTTTILTIVREDVISVYALCMMVWINNLSTKVGFSLLLLDLYTCFEVLPLGIFDCNWQIKGYHLPENRDCCCGTTILITC